MGKKDKQVFSENLIQKALFSDFLSKNTKKYEIFNMFVYPWESDYLTITQSGYAYECEIKISRNDFQNDFKHKKAKHLILEGKTEALKNEMISSSSLQMLGENEGVLGGFRPNYFYYAVPKDLITVEEVPSYAGLIYVYNQFNCQIVKKAPKLKEEPQDIIQMNLVDKFYYNYLTWRFKYEKECGYSEERNKILNGLKKDIENYDKMLSEANCKIAELELELKKYQENLED